MPDGRGHGSGPVRTGADRVRGAALCSVTERGPVAMALVEDVGDERRTPAPGGRLVVRAED
ncbi:hypothetical protein ACFWG6_38565 [Streptomyces erythrochromogenes]|uniref:hypothetical protein n=1 Tax=Streptomyces erythrochromogenes TaxID=285574 RepID=UPI0036354910